jgi:enolase
MQERGPLRGVADEGGWWPDFETNEQALETLVQAIERAGFVPGAQVAIALDIAASEFGRYGRYTLGLESRELDSDAMIELLLRWIAKYPIVVEDRSPRTTRRLRPSRCAATPTVVTNFLVSDAALVREAAALGAANTVLLKPNQRGTLTAHAAWRAARKVGYAGIVSARSGDRGHDHRPSGGRLELRAAQGRLVRPRRRMAKWNEALRVEERLGSRARFAGAAAFGRSRG